jgi:hypothetical protein
VDRIDAADPFGPLVKLKGSERLLRKMRTISRTRASRWRGSRRAASTSARRADPEEARDRRADRQDHPPRQVDVEVRRGEKGVRVGADA